MKGLDIFIVRLMPFIMYIYYIIVYILAWNGYANADIEYIFGNSLIFSASMFTISLSNKRYHCVWNRAMYIELMFVPTFNYLDAKFDLVPDSYVFLLILTASLILTFIITIYLAIRHFLKPRLKKMRYGKRKD